MVEALQSEQEHNEEITRERPRSIRFKKLALQGFKSFPERTEFLFNRDICAIVGPNGCGKSNVLDALKWVLGEQGPAQLRARAMADVIFNGAAQRKAVGMAEISLTVETPAGSIALDYEEVEVTRRLYRSGESEYLINKTPCRLKDIVDLFLDTGMSKGAYSLIEQGRVDALVTAKPDDRRTFLEQTAGIEKYKFRKKESLSKLASTEQNLARVQDVVAEIKSRRISLSRQAHKAAKYKELNSQLDDVQTVYLAGRYSRNYKELTELQKQKTHLENVMSRNASEFGLQSAALQESHKQVSEVQAELSRASESLDQAEMRIGYLEKRLEDLKKRDSELQQEENQAREEIIQLEKQKRDQDEQKQQLQKQSDSKHEYLENLRHETRQLETEYQDSQERLTEIREQLSILRSRRLIQIENQTRKQNEQMTLKEGLRRVNPRKEQLLVELASISESADTMKQTLTEYQNRREILSEENATLRSRLETLKTRHTEYQEQSREAESLLKDLESRMTRLVSRLDTLLELKKSGDGLNSGVKAVLERFRDKLLPDNEVPVVYGTLAEIYETSSDFEKAIAGALHNHLEDVVVPNSEALKTVIDFMNGRDLSKIVFHNLEEYDSAPLPEKSRQDNLIPAMECIQTAPEFTSLFDTLLQSVYLTRKNLSDPNPESRQPVKTLVDLSGNQQGPMGMFVLSGQQDDRLAYRHRLAEITELQNTLEGVRAELVSARETSQVYQSRYQETATELSRIASETAHKQQELAVAEKELSHQEHTVNSIQQRLKKTRDELNETDAEHSRLTRRLEELEHELQELSDDCDLQEEIEEVEIQATSYQRSADAAREKLMESRIRQKTTGEHAESLRQEARRMENDILRIDQMIQRLHAQTEKKETLRTDGNKEQEALTSEIAGLIHKQPVQRNLVENLKQRLSHVRKAEEALTKSVADLEKKDRDLERQIADIRVKIATVVSAVESLQEESPMNPQDLMKAYPDIPSDQEIEDWKKQIDVLKNNIRLLGDVNLAAEKEHRELVERNRFLTEQIRDIEQSISSLRTTIQQINRASKIRFLDAYEVVNRHFGEVFQKLFNGGEASLELIDPDDPLESGVDIICKPPGKRARTIDLLSGGEKALAALSLLLAGFRYRPSPLLFLDEVDAPLDDANVVRFTHFIKELSKITQVVMITHNPTTMEAADVLYGVTMENPGISKLVSARLNML